jgi:hypothetical protein
MVPTTISESAVDIRNQIDNRLAINARPSHNAANAQTPVMMPSRAERTWPFSWQAFLCWVGTQ